MLAGLLHRFRLNAKATSELGRLAVRGRVKVVGKARPGKRMLTAPITGRSCVFYSIDVGEWFNGAKTPLLSEHSTELFRIEDDTGSALIDPTIVHAYLRGTRLEGHSSDSESEHRTLLKRHGFTMVDEYGELRSLAYYESIILPNSRICALGEVSRQADPGGVAGYREQPQQSVISGDSEDPLVLSEI